MADAGGVSNINLIVGGRTFNTTSPEFLHRERRHDHGQLTAYARMRSSVVDRGISLNRWESNP